MRRSRFMRRAGAFGLRAGLVCATMLTLVVTSWEWLENPGGIFRSAEGTNWRFVFDTAVSWFFPTFLYTGGLAALTHIGRSAVRRMRDRRQPR